MIRRISITVLVLVLFVASGALAQQGRLVIWSATNAELTEALIEEFGKHYPRIQVDMIRAGSGQLITRLNAEQPRPSGDVLMGIAKETFDGNYHLFEGYVSANHDSIPSELKDRAAQPRYYGFSMPLQAIMVNTDLLSEDEYPTSWKDLADERFRGRLILANPAVSGSAYAQIFQMYELYGFDFLRKVVPNAVFTASSTVVPESIARGEYAVGVTGESNIAEHIMNGSPVKAIYPSEGTGARFDATGIIANAANSDNARLFMDFVTSREAYELVYRIDDRRTVHPDVEAPGPLPALSDIPLMDYDAVKASEIREQLTMDTVDLIW